MGRDPDRLNRIVLTFIGLACLVAGGWAIVRAAGWADQDDPDEPLLLPGITDFVARSERWFWPAAAALGVVVALVALVWVRAQLRLPRRANSDLVRRGPGGSTRITGDALAGALENDLVGGGEEIVGASVRIGGDMEDADIDLRVEIDERAQLDAVRRKIEDEVLPRFATATGIERTATVIDVRLAPPVRRLE